MTSLARTIGAALFRWRDLLPVPLVVGLAWAARPTRLTWLAGLPFVFVGEAVRVWSLMHIGPTTRTREICADRLVVSGPYALTRNPLYLANLLKVAGFLVIAGHGPFAVLALAFYAFEYATVIPFEEQFLEGKFPEAFAEYRSRVPVLLPRAWLEGWDARGPHSLAEAVRSERRTFASSGLLLALLWGAGRWNAGRGVA